jgi:hypothetical protein
MNHTGQQSTTLAGSASRGAIGFAIVSLAGFAVWAFGGKWFYAKVGEAGLYGGCTVVFVGLAGLLLHPLVAPPRRIMRFYKIFIPAFFAYAAVWSACWFKWHFGLGEWLASFFGCAAFAIVLAIAFGSFRLLALVIIVLFLLHSAGYFAGDWFYKWMNASTGRDALHLSKSAASLVAKLGWGICYGLGFGAGIGAAFHLLQKAVRPSA